MSLFNYLDDTPFDWAGRGSPNDYSSWTTKSGFTMRVVDMNTSHLINATAMICRTKMKRQHGIIDDYELNGLSNEELDRYFVAMMKELDYRLKQRKRRRN